MFTVASFQGPGQLFVTYSTEKHSSCNQKQRRPGNKTVFTVLLLGMASKGRQTLDLNSLFLVRNVTLVLNVFLCGVPYHVGVWVWVCVCLCLQLLNQHIEQSQTQCLQKLPKKHHQSSGR